MQRCGHGLRGDVRVGEQLEAERGQAGPCGGRTGLVAGEDRRGALLGHQPQALVDLVDDRDGRRERRLTGRVALAMRLEVEIEARHRRALHRGPGPRRGRDHGQARRRHPGLLRAGDHDVHAPGVHLERHGPETRDAVDEDERVGRLLADGRGELADRVHHPGRGLVVGQQHGLHARHGPELLADLVGGRRVAPLRIELRHVRAVDPGDLGEPVTERADRHAEHLVARRQRVDDSRLQAAGSGGRDHRHVRARPEERLHARSGSARASPRTPGRGD